jgi:phage tail-like protein
MTPSQMYYPVFAFQFEVTFYKEILEQAQSTAVPLCAGAFSEVSGLEATMHPASIPEGGRNYGMHQRVGPVDFATVILKRGMTRGRDLWKWFELVNLGASMTFRLNVYIKMMDSQQNAVMTWKLVRALPVKFKVADLGGVKTTEVAIEELHLVHEGLELEAGAA